MADANKRYNTTSNSFITIKAMKQPTLVVLAAGMGSRYGGLKQLDGVGPSGETIMDYSSSMPSALGFGKVVFVIRRTRAGVP